MVFSRQRELDADPLAVAHLTKTGINSEGCLRVAIRQAIAALPGSVARNKAPRQKPAPLVYRQDKRLEVVTLDPASGGPQTPQSRPASVDVDALLGQ